MPKQLRINDQKQIKESIKKYFSVNEDARFVRRLDMMLLICMGRHISEVAELFGVNATTVQRWIYRINAKGIEGLRDAGKSGRPPRLTNEKLETLRNDLEKLPGEFGYEQSRWDGKLLSHHLEINYGVNLRVRRCQILFKELGFSLQRPRKMPVGGDKDQREAFKKNFGGKF